MKSKWTWAVLAAALGVTAVYVGNVLATPSGGQTTSTVAHATVDDLDLNAHYMTTAVGGDGKLTSERPLDGLDQDARSVGHLRRRQRVRAERRHVRLAHTSGRA